MKKTPHDSFHFDRHTWSQNYDMLTFHYTAVHNNETFTFEEVLTLPQPITITTYPEELLTRILDNVSLALGLSYYKLFLPKHIILSSMVLQKAQAAFWNTVYTKGLGELFYNNAFDFRGHINFPYEQTELQTISFPRKDRALVGIGGGKDSIVASELLKKHTMPFTHFVVNPHPLRDEIISLVGVGSLQIKRRFDPKLFELEKRDDAYKGHVPVSAHYAFLGLLLGLLYDFKYVIVANEKSANYGNVTYYDTQINHQWSKSYEFESLFQKYVLETITPDISYFSLLRPFTEIAIMKQFVQYPHYFKHFSSCNGNFAINNSSQSERWCAMCGKCAFTFVILAAYLPKKEVLEIFGHNLLANENLFTIYKELLGISGHKPFDCVGTPEETKVAFALIHEKGEFESSTIMQLFVKEIVPEFNVKEAKHAVFDLSTQHHIPKNYQAVIAL